MRIDLIVLCVGMACIGFGYPPNNASIPMHENILEVGRPLDVDSFFFGKLSVFDSKENVYQKLGTPDSARIVDLDLGEDIITEWFYYKSYHILFESTLNGDSEILIIYSNDSAIAFGNGVPSVGSSVNLLRPYFNNLDFDKLILNGAGRIPFKSATQILDTWLVVEVGDGEIISISYDNTTF